MQEYFPRVQQAIPGQGFQVYAYFDDGTIRLFDAAPLIAKGGVFAPLQDRRFFVERLTVLNDTVAWDVVGDKNPAACVDIDPFTVYAAPRVADPLGAAV